MGPGIPPVCKCSVPGLAILLILAGCKLDSATRPDPVGDDPLSWSLSRRLEWSDFGGAPNPAVNHDAASLLGYDFLRSCRGTGLFFQVGTIFDREQSWVRPGAKTDRLLGHEQGHFDLKEYHARLMRKAAADHQGVCPLTAEGFSRFDAMIDSIGRIERTTQARYESESNHGLDLPGQEKWAAEIASLIGNSDSLSRQE